MKKSLMVLLIVLAQFTTTQAQTSYEGQIKTFNYLVGSDKMKGYALTTFTCDASKYKLPAFAPAPILQVYHARKKEFIGGTLESETGQKTIIQNITITTIGKDTTFTIVGKDFSRSFTLKTGMILKEEPKCSLFYTKDVGIWKVYKK